VGLLRRDDSGASAPGRQPAVDLSDSEDDDDLLAGFHLDDESEVAGVLPLHVQGLIEKQAAHICELQRHIAALESENNRLRKVGGQSLIHLRLESWSSGQCTWLLRMLDKYSSIV
jgi:hypothetical protein